VCACVRVCVREREREIAEAHTCVRVCVFRDAAIPVWNKARNSWKLSGRIFYPPHHFSSCLPPPPNSAGLTIIPMSIDSRLSQFKSLGRVVSVSSPKKRRQNVAKNVGRQWIDTHIGAETFADLINSDSDCNLCLPACLDGKTSVLLKIVENSCPRWWWLLVI